MKLLNPPATACPKKPRGSILALIILASVIITGIVMVMAFSSGVQAEASGTRMKTDEASYAAEGALQWAIFQLRQNPAWRPAATSPVVNGWTCAITCTDVGSPVGILGNPLKFTATASKSTSPSIGKASAIIKGVLAYAPQFWSLGNLSVAQSTHINGDVETTGTLTINPPSTGQVVAQGAKGTWKAKSIIIDNNHSGSSTFFTSTPLGNQTVSTPSMTAASLFATLKAGPTIPLTSCLTVDPATGNFIIDFSMAGGKPVYFNGTASYLGNVGIKSSANPSNDTLLIDGPANFTGIYPFNAASAHMNFLINGDVTFNGSGAGINITGSLYVAGNWSQQGAYNFKGTVMIDKSTTLAGTGLVDTAAPPAFDPRYIPRINTWVGNLP